MKHHKKVPCFTVAPKSRFRCALLFLLPVLLIGYSANAQTVYDPSATPGYDAGKASLVPAPGPGASTPAAPHTPDLPFSSSCFIDPDAGYSNFPGNDDGSVSGILLPFTFQLYGVDYTSLYLNNNGNITFVSPEGSYVPTGFPFGTPMIAPFWADVDTRVGTTVKYEVFPHKFIATWPGVGYYNQHTGLIDSFQVIITDGTDPSIGLGNNVAFYYGQMNWTTGDASGGSGGFGGSSATVGINAGDGVNYVQVGRFGLNSSAYTDNTSTSGVHYLEYRCFPFNVAGAGNVPPSVSGLPAGGIDTIISGCTSTINLSWLPPEVDQLVSTTVDAGGLCNTTVTTSPGFSVVATDAITITGAACNMGTNTITVTATDNHGGVTTQTITIVVIPQPTASSNSPVCQGGTLNLTTSGAPGVGTTYSWSGPGFTSTDQNPSLSGATTSGDYNVTVTYGGCATTITTPVVVNPPAVVTISASGPTSICPGDSVTLSVGTINGTPASGTTSFINATNSSGPTTVCNCPPGYAAVGYTGRTGCWLDQYILQCQKLTDGVLSGPIVNSAPNGTSTGGDPAGPFPLGGNNVLVGAHVTEASSGYLYGIDGFGQDVSYVGASGNNNSSPVDGGNMTGSCGGFDRGYLWAPNGTLITGMYTYNNYYSTGIAFNYTAEALFNTGAVTWSNGAATDSIVVKASGDFSVTVVDNNGCIGVSPVTSVTVNPLPPTPVLTGPAAVCAGAAISLTPDISGGTWASSDNTIATVDASGNIGGVNGGVALISYTLTSDLGCTVSATQSVTVTSSPISGPTTLSPGYTTTLTDATTGGVWNSLDPGIASVDPVTGTVTGGTIGVTTISYSVNGCTNTAPMAVSVCTPTYSYDDYECYYNLYLQNFSLTGEAGSSITDLGLGCDGTGYQDRRPFVGPASVTPGGTYTVSITEGSIYGIPENVAVWIDFNNDGSFLPSELVGGLDNTGGTFTFTITIPPGVADGTYNLRVRSGYNYSTPDFTLMDGCSDYVIGDGLDYKVTICRAPAIVTCAGPVTRNNDAGLCTAAVAAYPAPVTTGTTPAITYSIPEGSVFAVGVTTVTATAANSCGTASCDFTVAISDAEKPSITPPANVTINGYCVPVAVTLGTPVTGDNCGVLDVTNDWPGGPFPVGTTTVNWTVTDIHGNTNTAAQTVTINPSTLTFATHIDNVGCHGGYDGHIDADVSGGTAPYSYTWNTGGVGFALYDDLYFVPAGTYTVTATDAHGCSVTGAYTVTQPASLTVTGTPANVSCNGAHNGSINPTVAGGTTPYYYSWSTGSHAASISGLAPGTYLVTVTDAHGCFTTGSYTITQPAALSAGGTVANVTCNGASNGSITSSVTGGTPAYNYTWSTGSHTPNLTGLAVGTYTLTVSDGHGCGASHVYTITQPAALSVGGTVANVTCNGAHNGSITSSVTGGTPAYSYTWSTGPHTANLTGMAPGTYTLTVSDGHGCSASHVYTVTQPSALSVSCGASPVYCFSGGAAYTIYLGYGPSSVTLSASASGGTPGYTYSWSPGSGHSASMTVSPTVTTTYTVTVTDAHGCTSTCTETIYVIDIRCADHKSVYVCHYGGTISCGTGDVPGHLAHGDYCGPCHKSGAKSADSGDDGSGLPDEANTDEIRVYPNPSEGVFSVEIPAIHKNAVVMITDLTGRVLENRTISENTGAPVQFNINSVARGIYLVKVNAGDKFYIDKIVVR